MQQDKRTKDTAQRHSVFLIFLYEDFSGRSNHLHFQHFEIQSFKVTSCTQIGCFAKIDPLKFHLKVMKLNKNSITLVFFFWPLTTPKFFCRRFIYYVFLSYEKKLFKNGTSLHCGFHPFILLYQFLGITENCNTQWV